MDPDFLLFASMTPADVAGVAAIEAASFPAPYPARLFQDELRHGHSASWWVVRPETARGDRRPAPVLAYAGYYLRRDRAHLAKIATHPAWRRRRLGEWVLLNTLLAARGQGAAYMTLEVRAGNTAAQRFYLKWGFELLRRIKGYYEDTGEDGLILAFTGLETGDAGAWLSREMDGISIIPPE